MASRKPLQCLRTLQQHHLTRPHIHTQPLILLSRLFSTTPTPSERTTTPAPKRSKAIWKRAIKPPQVLMSWDEYAMIMKQRPKSEANRLAQDNAETPALPAKPDSSGLDITKARLVPASPSYFSSMPNMVDDMVYLSTLLKKNGRLPKIPRLYAPKAVWKPLQDYRLWIGERVPPSRYVKIKGMLMSLNRILPELRTQEVKDALNAHLKDPDRVYVKPEPGLLDEWGRGFGKGRRKTAKAMAYVVEGSGEVLVNERNITDVFGRVKDRESALWPLTATGRMSRYNVFAVVKGGGTTGWAEAMALAVAKAVLAHEPGLKGVMRKAGVITRDPRMVERKKPGHVKARKMPAWVKR